MAKSKLVEEQYKAEGLRRSHIRKEQRIQERKRKLRQYGKVLMVLVLYVMVK